MALVLTLMSWPHERIGTMKQIVYLDNMDSAGEICDYQFEIDRITNQRIPSWLCNALLHLICYIAAEECGPFGFENFNCQEKYESIQEMLADQGWYVRRTAVYHAYLGFMDLDADRIRAIASRPQSLEQMIPLKVRDLVGEIKDALQIKSFDVLDNMDEEVEDLVGMLNKPTALANCLDRYSLDFPGSVNRAIRIAMKIKSMDIDAAEVESQAWAALGTLERYDLERSWATRAEAQDAADYAANYAFTAAKKLEAQVQSDMRAFRLKEICSNSSENRKYNTRSKSPLYRPDQSSPFAISMSNPTGATQVRSKPQPVPKPCMRQHTVRKTNRVRWGEDQVQIIAPTD